MTTSTLWAQATETVTAAGATGGGSLGTEFTVTSSCTLTGIWLYSPSGHSLTGLPGTIALYTTAGTLVHSETPTWSGAAGSGWVRAAFSSPPTLSTGTTYMAVVFDSSATAVWFIYNSSGWGSNITSGPLSAVAANQGWYDSTTGAVSFPTSQLTGYSWYLDPEVSSAASNTRTASLTVSPSFSAARARATSRTAALTVTPALVAHATGGTIPSNAILDEAGDPVLDEAGGFILDESTGGAHAASASLTVTPVLGASSPHGDSRTASLTVTPVLSAARSHAAVRTAALTVTPVLAAAGSQGFPVHLAAASLTVTPAIAAATLHKHFPSAALTVTPVIAAAAVRGRFRSAALTVTPVIAAADSAHHVRTASLTVTPVIAAGRSGHHVRTASLTVSPVLAVTAAHAAGAPPGYPDGELGAKVELSLGGTWTDITALALQDGQQWGSIKSGQADGAQQPSPGAMPLSIDNPDYDFSPRNSASPYYGQLRLNTAARVSVAATYGSYLRLEANASDRASATDATAMNITGSIEMRIALRLSDWQGGLLAQKWDTSSSWFWQLNPNGTMWFGWVDSSVAVHEVLSTAPVPWTSGDMALKVTMNAATGTVTFYASDSIDGTYTQVGTAASGTSGAATTIRSTSSPLIVGWASSLSPAQLLGQVYEYRLYSGIGGTVVADAVFSALTAGVTSWTDSKGIAWATGGGAEISDRDYRLHGELSSLIPSADISSSLPKLATTVSGRTRRLQQGSAPVAASPMRRGILSQAGSLFPVAYWTLEDGSQSTAFGPAAGIEFMNVSGTGAVKPAADSSFLASAPLPELNGTTLHGEVDTYTGGTAWVVRFTGKINSLPASGMTSGLAEVLVSGGAAAQVNVNVDSSGNLQLIGRNSGGTTVFDSGFVAYGAGGQAWWYSIEAIPVSGGKIQYNLVVLAPGSNTGGQLSTLPEVSGSLGTVTDVYFNTLTPELTDTVVGHVSVQKAWVSMFSLWEQLNAWQGELAAARFTRICAEEGITCRILGFPLSTAAMGGQPRGSVWAILKDCAWADQGLLYEPRDSLSVGFRTRASMMSQGAAVTLDFSVPNLPGNLSPADDDLDVVNDVTGSMPNGTVYRAQLNDGSPTSVSEPPTGLGRYASSPPAPFNVAAASQLPDVVGWYLSTRSVDVARYRQVTANLGIPGAPVDDVSRLQPGDLLVVSNPPGIYQSGDIEQIVTGATEVLGPGRSITWDCVPAAPYA